MLEVIDRLKDLTAAALAKRAAVEGIARAFI